MMTNIKYKFNKVIKGAGVAVLGAALAFGFTAQSSANTTANASIVNLAVVTWDDDNGTPYVRSDSVTVTVNLVESAVVVTGLPSATGDITTVPADLSIANATELVSGETGTYYYAINPTANGTDNYTVSLQTVSLTDFTNGGATAVSFSAFTLGSTLTEPAFSDSTPSGSGAGTDVFDLGSAVVIAVTDQGSGTARLTVPAGTSATSHGLATGDLVRVGGDLFVVGTVSAGTDAVISSDVLTPEVNGFIDISTFSATTIDGNAIAQATNPNTIVSAGDIVSEIIVVRVEVTGSVDNNAAFARLDLDFDVTDTGTNAFNVNFGNLTDWEPLNLTIQKYVRNVSVAVTGADGPGSQINSSDFYATGVTADPGQTLEYLVIVDNNNGLAISANSVVVSDAVPDFTSLFLAAVGSGYGGAGGTQDGTVTTDIFARIDNQTDFSTAIDFDVGTGAVESATFGAASTTGSPPGTITFNLGTGATTSAGGAIADTQTLYIIYQVVVD